MTTRLKSWFWLFILPMLIACSGIPNEVPLILEAKAKAEEHMEAEYQKLLTLSVGERSRLQGLLLEQELRGRWLAASSDGAVPLTKLPEIEAWAREQRIRHEAEKQTAINHYGNSVGIRQQRQLTSALREWMKTRVDTEELLNLQRIIEAIQARPPPVTDAGSNLIPPQGGTHD